MRDQDRIALLEKKVAELSSELERQQDVQAIRRLHHTYGYCMDKWLFDDIVEMFADDCILYFMDGIFHGKAGAKRFFSWSEGKLGPQDGKLGEHLMLQDVIDVAPDRSKAWARFRCFLQGGVHEKFKDRFPPTFTPQFWEGGVYENEYVRERGAWKVKVFNYRISFQCEHEHGWAKSPLEPLMCYNFKKTYPELANGPDQLRGPQPQWPYDFLMPFHYRHPVTGEVIGGKS